MTGYNMYGIDIISMRGYDDGALDPVGSNYSCAYNKYTMELRYPLLLKGQTNIYVLGSWKEATDSPRGRSSPRSRSNGRRVSACASSCRS